MLIKISLNCFFASTHLENTMLYPNPSHLSLSGESDYTNIVRSADLALTIC